MIYTIVSLIAIVTSSQANRLLLQGAAPGAPAAPITPGMPSTPLPAAPAPPAAVPLAPITTAAVLPPPDAPLPPPAPIAPAPPVGVPPPAAPAPPVYPGQGPQPGPVAVPPAAVPIAPAPPVYPGQGLQPQAGVPPAGVPPGAAPGAPGVPGAAPNAIPPIPAIPALPATPPQPFLELNCVIPHGMLGSCAMKPNNVMNPPMNFKMNCAAYGGCYGSTINLDFNAPVGPPGYRQQFMMGMPSVDYRIDGIWASEPYAFAYGTLNIRNHGGPGSNNVVLEQLDCSNYGACLGTTINLWGASVNDVECPMPSDCTGCVIIDHSNVPPQAKPCWGY